VGASLSSVKMRELGEEEGREGGRKRERKRQHNIRSVV
jgi:hypothetical protein